MARITLPGEQVGTYSIAGLFFVDGVTEVDELSAKQAYLLGVLMGAELPDDLQVHDVPPAEQDVPAAPPEEQGPARSSADDLSAYAAGVSLTDIVAEPQDPPQADTAAPETDDQANVVPTVPDVEPAPETGTDAPADEQTDEGTGEESTPVDAQPDGTTSELSADGTDISDTVTTAPEFVPPAQDPIDADVPAPVIGEAEDGSTTTEAAVQPDAPAEDTTPAAADPVVAAAATDTVDPGAVDGGTAPAGADVSGSTDTAATGA
jgi:hypothetical protein